MPPPDCNTERAARDAAVTNVDAANDAATVLSGEINELDIDINSLQVLIDGRNTDIASLQAANATDIATQTAKQTAKNNKETEYGVLVNETIPALETTANAAQAALDDCEQQSQ